MESLLDESWDALTVGSSVPIPTIEVRGALGNLRSALPVEDVAAAAIGLALAAGAVLNGSRSVTLDRGHVATAVRSERYFRRGDQSAGSGFAPLSRFWRTADGWVRTHANYPWHRAALLSVLGVADHVDAVAAAMAERISTDVEDAVFAAGGVAAAVRSHDEWSADPQGRAVAAEPLIGHRRLDDSAPRQRTGPLRILDLTRVIAGPVCTRLLGALGADVLRLDPPGHLDMAPGAVADTLLGKRSAFLDFEREEEQLHALVDRADVVVCGYRPGSLDRFDLDEGRLAERHPGVVAVYLSAWGHTGPWSGRRGFDSIVQAPTGIAVCESADGSEPGALPCQLLDHATGYLAAAAALDGLRRQSADGGTHIRRVSLARTAAWLIGATAREGGVAAPMPNGDVTPWLAHFDTGVTAVLPPGEIDGRQLSWPRPPAAYGREAPAFLAPT